jgi:hypothetical protein
MPTILKKQRGNTALALGPLPRAEAAPGGYPPVLPVQPLIDDTQVSAGRTWSSQRIAAELAGGGAGGGGGGGGTLYLASIVGGTGDAITLTAPGLTLGATEVLLAFDPLQNNTGPATVAVNGGAAVPILGRQNAPLIASEIIAPITVILRISASGAKIVSGSV